MPGVLLLTMERKITSARCATAAIAAVLVLGSTGLSAQVVPPQVDPPAAPPPEIVPPLEPAVPVTPQPTFEPPAVPPASPSAAPAEAAAPIMRSSPVVQALPEPEASVESPPAAIPAGERKPPVAARANPAPVPAPAMQAAPEEAGVPSEIAIQPEETSALAADPAADSFAPQFAPEPAAPEEENRSTPANPVITAIDAVAWGAAGTLLLLALGAGPLRRRRPKGEPPKVVRPQVQPPLEPVRATPQIVTVTPTLLPQVPRPHFAARSRSDRAAVDLPRVLPARFEERDALLKRMLDAPPDKANPFRSRRARLKRARLILQSIGRRFERADPWIDLSDYPHVWPELARRRHLQAA